MSEFLAFEYTDVHSFEAWAAEPVLRQVRRRYAPVAWWRRAHTTPSGERGRWAARAAYAAEHQGSARGEAVLRRLLEATFVDGTPVADIEGIRSALAGVPGLDVWRLIRDLDSPDVVWAVDRDHAMALRHGFTAPTVLFRGPRGDRVVAGRQPLEAYVEAIEAVVPPLEAKAA